MKSILLFVLIAVSQSIAAQVTKISLQASGLTCSMCSNAINKALGTLDYISNIDADIKTYTFEISIKPNSNVDFDEVKKKVENAGFTVCGFVATIYFNNAQVRGAQQVNISGDTFIFVNAADEILSGEKTVKIIDKGYVSLKEYKKAAYNTFPGTYHAILGSTHKN